MLETESLFYKKGQSFSESLKKLVQIYRSGRIV